MKRIIAIVCMMVAFGGAAMSAPKTDKVTATGTEATAKKTPNKGLLFFYRTGEKVDRLLLQSVDTDYICLPDHSWHVELTNGEVGIHSTYTTWLDPSIASQLISHTTPSIELGFNAGYRGFGFGYSWDLMNAYTTHWNLSLGGQGYGVEFRRDVSTNMHGQFQFNDGTGPGEVPQLEKGEWMSAYTSLSAWYALNAAHYSHNAATKQSYIQRKSAGSLLLSVAYMSSQMQIMDSLKYLKDPSTATVIDGVTGMITRQVAVGIGYGINYTPNKGKVVLHAAANMQVVCYSINHITYEMSQEMQLPGNPLFMLRPSKPVHVTGNMRAAVSWEINEWVHLCAWGQANNLRFESQAGDLTFLQINNWYWQARINIGVRFGAGKKRIREALGDDYNLIAPSLPVKNRNIPKWISEFFYY